MSLGLLWINFLHLFLISLLPFTTAWMARTQLASVPVMVYAALFVCVDAAYNVFEYQVLRRASGMSARRKTLARRRSLLALCLFAAAVVAAAFEPWIGFGLICIALMLHIKPDVGAGFARRKPGPRGMSSGSDDEPLSDAP